ncbi:MAG: cupin domain-containing protein [Pseudomonadota bacterium]
MKAMVGIAWPEMIESLPDIDLDAPGVRGKLLQAGDKQLVFFEIEPIGVIPPHSHSAQWGIVVEGEIEMTIGGETRTCRKGDSYFIPACVEHSARVRTKVKAIDIFDEPSRYRPRV